MFLLSLTGGGDAKIGSNGKEQQALLDMLGPQDWKMRSNNGSIIVISSGTSASEFMVCTNVSAGEGEGGGSREGGGGSSGCCCTAQSGCGEGGAAAAAEERTAVATRLHADAPGPQHHPVG